MAVLSVVITATETVFTGTQTKGRFFVVVAFAFAITSLKQTTLFLVSFFCRA
jgi:hypothetical protein